MRRKLIVGERIMHVDAETPLNCVFTVKIKGMISMEQLRNALLKLQQKHPLLRSVIKEDSAGIPHFVSSNSLSEIPIRIVERVGDDDWKAQSEIEWAKPFLTKTAPMARLVWLKGTLVSDLMLICPHCVCDGTTFVTLMSEMLLVLDKPDTILPSYLPFNSIEGLLAQSFSKRPGMIVKARLFAVFAKLFFLLKPAPKEVAKGKNYMLHWRLDTDQTNALIKRCKANDATVHAALSVAFLSAFRSVRGDQAKGKVISPVDIRKFVPEIKADMMFAFAPIAELGMDTNVDIDLWTKARKFKAVLNAKIAAMKIPELLILSEYFHGSVPKMVKYLKSTAGGHDVTLSNMGKLGIAEHYDSFELERIYSPTVGFPWRNPNTLVVSTYKREMDFTFFSNDAFLSAHDAALIKNQAMDLLEPDFAHAL